MSVIFIRRSLLVLTGVFVLTELVVSRIQCMWHLIICDKRDFICDIRHKRFHTKVCSHRTMAKLKLWYLFLFYRPQTKFAKVKFSQVFVCPEGDSVQGVSVHRGSLSRGVSVQEGLSRGSLSGSLCQVDPLYSYVRAVPILLDCILVRWCFSLSPPLSVNGSYLGQQLVLNG